MFAGFSFITLTLIFSVSAIIVWIAGIQLSLTTDRIDNEFRLSQVFGGLIFLAITTNLPEIAIVISAAFAKDLGLAVGNILGGIAIQTVVLVIFDYFGLGKINALTHQVASLQLVVEGILVIIILVIVIIGAQLPSNLIYARIAPGDLLIVFTWIIGIYLVSKARYGLPWHKKGYALSVQPYKRKTTKKHNMIYIYCLFTLAALATLVAGVLLEESSRALAHQIGLNGVIFGATILAAVTALPEISTGMAAMKIGDYSLAVSDIFGGNAFLPVLFFPATVISGQSVLPHLSHVDIYLSSIGSLLTAIYIYGFLFRPKQQYFSMGVDSLLVIIIYLIGIIGLFSISS